MKIRIPHELKIKFLRQEGLVLIQDTVDVPDPQTGFNVRIPTTMDARIDLDLSREPELLKVCQEWINLIETYFKTSYNAAKIDIGPYEGLWPTHISEDRVAHFRIDDFNPERKHWKDWFVIGDTEYAPFKSA